MPRFAMRQGRLLKHSDCMQPLRFAALGASLAIVLCGFTYSPPTVTASSSTTTIVSGVTKPLVALENPDSLKIGYTGSPDLVRALESGAARPTALAAADFDLDGVADLVIGYATASGGVIALLRGNPDAFAPKDQNLYQSGMRGDMPPTFLSMATVFGVPESPDFLATGDFNHDGYEDLLVGKKRGGLYLLNGDGRGNLLAPEPVSLPGEVTALTATSAGHVAVGTDGPEGPRLVVFAPSRNGLISAATYTLPALATSIAWGALGGGTGTDLAVSSGTSVVVIYSALSARARRATVNLRFHAEALTLGDFIWDRNGTTEMAILGSDGLVRILRHRRLDTRPFATVDFAAREAMPTRPTAVDQWTVTKLLGFAASPSSGVAAQSMLQSPRLAVSPTHDLVILDAAQSQISIFDTFKNKTSARATVKVGSAPVATYAPPPKLDGGRDLVVLTSAQVAPMIVQFEKAAIVNVNTTADTDQQSACANKTIMPKDLRGMISLRTAVCAANNYGTMGPVTINVPAGTYHLTSLDTGELQVGLVPGSDISIIGTGTAATTIIQQTDGIDRVFNFDPNLVGSVRGAVSNVTVTGGSATSLGGGGMLAGFIGDSYTIANAVFANNTSSGTGASGGGIDVRGGSLSMTNCTITNNTAQANVGGGVAITNGTGSRGDVLLINTLVTGNTATGNGSSPGQGGGVFIDIDTSSSATISGSTVMLNTATGSSGQGGGIFNQAGSLSVINSRVVGNQSGDASGIYTLGFDATATDNWWGCNDGPGASGCDTVGGGGTVSVNPWLVLSISASPTQVKPRATSTLSADLTHDSSGSGGFSVPIGTPVSFSGVLGSVQPSQTTLANGIAASAYTAGPDPGAGQATAKVDNQSVSVIIDIVQAPAIINTNHTTFKVGNAGLFRITTAGFPAPTITKTGTLPTGVGFEDNGNGTGTLAGLAAAGTGGSYKIIFTARNGIPSKAQQNFILTIHQAPAITSADNTNFQLGMAGSFTVTTMGFPPSSITQTGELPKDIGFVDNHDGTGTLSGTPTIAGVFNAELSATNNAGNAKQNFTLTVQKANSSTTLSSSANPSGLNQSVVLSARVSSNGTGTPKGKVKILDGGIVLGSPDLDASGEARLSTASLTAGTHNITATYLGDDTHASSTSPVVRQVVMAAAQFLLTVNPTILTLRAGTPANFTITATGQNGFNSAVSLACTTATLPLGATCQFSPRSIAPGASPATSALTVTTTAPTWAKATPSFRGQQLSSLYAIWLAMPALLVSTVGLGDSRRRKIAGYCLAFVLIAGCLLQSACGSGMAVGGNGGSMSTPVGTFNILVTGTSNANTQTAAITMTVR
jgi:hypothetical protein